MGKEKTRTGEQARVKMKPKAKLNRIASELTTILEKIIQYDKYGILNKKDLKVIENETEVMKVRIKHLKDATKGCRQ